MERAMSSAATPEGVGAGRETATTSPGAGRSLLRGTAPFRRTRPSSIHCVARERETSSFAASHASSRSPPASSPATSSTCSSVRGGAIQLLFQLLLLAPEREGQHERAAGDRDVDHVEH